MCIYTTVIDASTLIISFLTMILLCCGLQTWKMQIKGENKFNLAWSVLKELKLLMNNINEYRSQLIYTNYDLLIQNETDDICSDNTVIDKDSAFRKLDIEKFNSIIVQFYKYESKLSELMILVDKEDIDYINGKKMRYFILDLEKSHFEINEINYEYNTIRQNKFDVRKRCIEINKILHKTTGEDKWGLELDKYIIELKEILRKYMK